MLRVFAIFLIVLSLSAGIGEFCGLLLPTLSWPFTAAREMSFLHASGFDEGIWTHEGRFLWFGWLCVLAGLVLGVSLLALPRARLVISPISHRRWKRFRSIRRGYFSFLLILLFCFLAALDQCLVGKRALFVEMNGRWYFPAFTRTVLPGSLFGLAGNAAQAEADYRLLDRLEGEPGFPAKVIMPPVPFDPTVDAAPFPIEPLERRGGLFYRRGDTSPFNGQASRLYSEDGADQHLRMRFRQGMPDGPALGWDRRRNEVYSARYRQGALVSEHYTGEGTVKEFLKQSSETFHFIYYHPSPPLIGRHLLGTNSQGADIVAWLFGGLQVNLKAALLYLPIVYGIGLTVGLSMGYFGGRFDLIVQRCIEILAQIPFLFVIMILSDLAPLQFKGLFLTAVLLSLFGWMSMSYLLRTSAMKEKTRDYVAAARVMGASTPRILFTHILPNQLAIIVTLAPFSVSAVILSIASLDYLGFGLPDTCASWGRLLNDGLANLSSPWIVTSGFAALAISLLLVTFTGEAVREAFDPKRISCYK